MSAWIWVGDFANSLSTLVLLALPLIAIPALGWVARIAIAIFQEKEAADASQISGRPTTGADPLLRRVRSKALSRLGS